MLTIADSIGIKLIASDCLLIGVGNELHEYYLDSTGRTLHQKICVNFRSKIYGITSFDGVGSAQSDEQFVVIYGGREVAVLHQNEHKHLNLVKRLSLNDWISSIRVYESKANDGVSFCIVSAHSVASEFKVHLNGHYEIINKSSCVDKCTLYCSFILGDCWMDTTIFGGTAFGELIIWQANGDDDVQRSILHRLSGHNGVIFSINCSIKHNLITTTSDDRSVKMWNLKSATHDCIDWTTCSVEPSKSMFGHTARVFGHKIIEYNEKAYIITAGEDGNVCIWSNAGRLVNREPIARGVLWNLDYDATRQYLFACGNDGNVHQLSLTKFFNETHYVCEKIEADSIVSGEYVTKLVVLQSVGVVVILTSNQQLISSEISSIAGECDWIAMPDAETEYKITVLEAHGSLVATAGYQYFTIYQFKNGQFRKVYHNKPPLKDESPLLRSLEFITETEFVICDARGNGCICTIDENFNIEKVQHFEMPPSKERWLTTAARFQNYLVIGDRHGNMHLFEIGDNLILKHTLRHVHGNLGCKTIFQLTTSPNRFQFETAGHQSKVKTLCINDNTKELELKATHDIPVKWCDKAVRLDSNQNYLLAGFNERHFIACHQDNSYRFEIDCGGGHRAWDLYIDAKTSRAHLFFVRSKLMQCGQFDLHDSRVHPFSIYNKNWHTWPCNAMRVIRLNAKRFVIASGGDDNLLKFNEIHMNNELEKRPMNLRLQHNFDMVRHISNIRSVFALKLADQDPSNDGMWLIFSAGGRAQICVTELKIHQNAVQFHEIGDFMLRSSDLDRKRKKHTQIIYFDPETRFMSSIAYHRPNDICLIVGCSDGFIRSFKYTNGTISLDQSLFYGRCILNVYHFQYANRNYLISMSTDGVLVFWSLDDFSDESMPIFKHQHHDSGINSFDIIISEKLHEMIVATGGDDQAIVISTLNLQPCEKNLEISLSHIQKFPDNHTAQVNGVKFSADKKYLYSISVDQTVLEIDLNSYSIRQTAYSCVSDAKGLQILNEDNILIYGCGMQVINL